MKALAFGDLQIGAGSNYGVLPGDRLRDQEQAIEASVDLAIEHQVDFVIAAGDLFDGPIVTPEHYAAFQKPMRRLKAAGIPCLAVLGNGRHDCALRDVTAPAVVSDVCEFFAEPGVRKVGDVYVAMLPWCPISRLVAENDGGNRAELFQAAADRLIQVARGLKAQIPADSPSILVPHFAISGAMLNNGLPVDDLREVILPLMELEGLGFSAVAAGHIHRHQFLSSLMPADEVMPIFYVGSLLPVDFSERDAAHGVSLVTFDGPGAAHVEFIPVPSRPFVQLECDLTAEGSSGLAFVDLGLEGNKVDLRDAVVKVMYRATREQAARVSHQTLTDAILASGASKVYSIVSEIERPSRARVEGVDETLSATAALDAYIDANDLDVSLADAVRSVTGGYLDRVAATSTSVAGGVKPLRIRARNMRTYENLDWTIPPGVVALVGSNGAGKSTIVNGVDVGLFCGRGELGSLLTSGEDELELTLEFESAGHTYRARRQLRRGKAQTVDLEVLRFVNPEQWEPISLSSADATNERITEIVGLSRKTFGASAFLRQGDGAAFTEAGAAARKSILIEVCGIEEWDSLLALAKTDVAAAEREIADIQRRYEIADVAVADKATVAGLLTLNRGLADKATADLAAAEIKLAEAQQALAATETAAERVRAAQAELDAATKDEQRIRAAVDEAKASVAARAAAQARLLELGPVADRVEELESQTAELQAMKARADAALTLRASIVREAEQLTSELQRRSRDNQTKANQVEALEGKLAPLRDHPADGQTCDRCEQHLGAEARDRAIASYQAEISALTDQVRQESRNLEDLETRIAGTNARADAVSVPEVVDPGPTAAELVKARAAVEQRATVTAQLQAHEEKAFTLPRLEQELDGARRITAAKRTAIDEAKGAVGDTEALKYDVTTERHHVTELRTQREHLTSAIARDEALMERIETAEGDIRLLAAGREAVQNRLDVLRVACKAYGRDGVPALIVENSAIPQIEQEANRILQALDTRYHVELRTQREQKNDQVTETLDIVINDGVAERPYETFSGGERTRLNLALRIGLAELLAQRKAASSLLVIDEPEFLDEAGVILLVDVLRSLAGVFTTIVLVTHHPAGAASCDRQIQVVKDGDRSRILADEPPSTTALKEAA